MKKKFFSKFFKNAKLKSKLNSSNVYKLSKIEIKEITKEFNKQKVLIYKIKLFKKLVKKAENNIEAHSELKRVAVNLGLRFNRATRIAIKSHYTEINFFNKPIQKISTDKMTLNKNEELYLELGAGFFTDIPHIIHFKRKKYN